VGHAGGHVRLDKLPPFTTKNLANLFTVFVDLVAAEAHR
jgi:hypothetical protein